MTHLHRKTIREVLGRGPVHPFPARMAPGVALEVISESDRPLRVLDPMMGSGTVLAVARAKGHEAIGFDIDPLAVLITKVWTMATRPETVRDKGREVLARARDIFAGLSQEQAYPQRADLETRRFVSYWFDGYARRQLASLSLAISRVRDEHVRDILWCAFSRLIIAKQSGASLAMDLAHSRPHRMYHHAPAKPFRKFGAALERVLENCIDARFRERGPAPRIYFGDARHLPLQEASVDIVLTSPPYLNAIDYMRTSKYSLVWMGYSISALRKLRSESVGTEASRGVGRGEEEVRTIIDGLRLRPPLQGRYEAVLDRYVSDVLRLVSEVARVLRPGGTAVWVIGDNTVRGTYVPNSLIVSAAARLSGLSLLDRRTRALPAARRYLPPPASGGTCPALNSRIRREVLLTFAKGSPRTALTAHWT
jgi:SAM-dependent methyltransferase